MTQKGVSVIRRRITIAVLAVTTSLASLIGTFAAAASPASPTRELLSILHAKGEISDEQFQSLSAELDAQDKSSATPAAQPTPDWLDRFTLFGDARVRGEAFFQDRQPDRDRFRVRARLGVKATASDELEGTVRLATGDPNDPISTNQTFSEAFTRKPVSLDQAFLTVKPASSLGFDRPYLTLTAGKMPLTVFRPKAVGTSEMIFDDDLTPEGMSETGNVVDAKDGVVRKLSVQAVEWSLKELTTAADSWIFGGQVTSELAVASRATLTVAFGNYYLSGANRLAQQINTDPTLTSTNALVLKDGTVFAGGVPFKLDTTNPVVRYAGGFNLVEPSLSLVVDTGAAAWPLAVFADFVHNTEAQSKPDAYWVGVGVGQTKNPGEWAVSAIYAHTETNAVISALSYSDFGRSGGTNQAGPFLKIDWMPLSRLVLTVKNHFVTFADTPKGKSSSIVNRLQLDAAYTF